MNEPFLQSKKMNAIQDEIPLGRKYDGLGPLVGRSPVMKEVYRLIQRVAPTHAPVMVVGATGTGKELVARSVHECSERSEGPYIAINCGAITHELMCSALFGHEKGSFTGATTSHKGYFEQASGGTLFLDELPETTTDLQVKLLRVLETNTIIPVGGKRPIPVDVRIVVATNRNLKQAIQEGLLRRDLFYRLNTFPIHLPLLNQRDEDISYLAQYFLEKINHEYQKDLKFSSKSLAWLKSLPWPGNVRQLKNTILRASIMADTVVEIEHLHDEFLEEVF